MSSEKLFSEVEATNEVVIINHSKMPFCGPKLSNCCFVLSIWGMIMLVIMGILFRVESIALLEDIPKMATEEEGYHAASTNCFIAAGLYVAVFVICVYQKYAINRGYSRL